MGCYDLTMSIVANTNRIFQNKRIFTCKVILTMTSLLSGQHVRSLTALTTIQVGLTGSIGMGKSTCTKHFRAMGFPVFDADAAVHELYSVGGDAVDPIRKLFPDAIVDLAVSRPLLGKKIMEDSCVLQILEEIVHPLVAAKRRLFLESAKNEGHFMVVYDIPLLLENPQNHEVDYTVVATASASVQKERVLKRPGMTEEKFASILAKQMPDERKRELADYLVHTDFDSLAPGRAQVAKIVESIIEKNPDIWTRWKELPSRTTHAAEDTRDSKLKLKHQPSECSLTDNFDLVVFDLDDTLVPVWGPIKPAMEALFLFLDEHMPLTAATARDTLSREMTRISSEEKLLAHDLTEVRRLALNVISTPHGEQGKVDEALELFVAARSNVFAHLYDDVLPCLKFLTKDMGVRVAVLTNGNANLTTCPVLGEYISLSLGACDVGRMKPSPVPFIAIAQRTGVHPSRILFIGDSFEKDVIGARAVGMTGGLLLRNNFKSQNVPSSEENSEVYKEITEKHVSENNHLLNEKDYIVFNNLYPEEMTKKLDTFWDAAKTSHP